MHFQAPQARFRIMLIPITLLSVVLSSCDRFEDGWSNGQVPSSVPNDDVWLVASGTAGQLISVHPRIDPPGQVSRIRLSIDCYITDVAVVEDQVFVAGTRSRNRDDSPGGVYRVNIETGSATLIASAEMLGGSPTSLFVTQERRSLIVHGDGYVCQLSTDSDPGIEARIDIPRSTFVTPVGESAVLVVGSRSPAAVYPMDGGQPEPIADMPKSIAVYQASNAPGFLGVTQHSTRLYTLTDGRVVAGQIISQGDFRGVISGGFFLPGGALVVVGSYEVPYHTFWLMDDVRLNTPGIRAAGAARLGPVGGKTGSAQRR